MPSPLNANIAILIAQLLIMSCDQMSQFSCLTKQDRYYHRNSLFGKIWGEICGRIFHFTNDRHSRFAWDWDHSLICNYITRGSQVMLIVGEQGYIASHLYIYKKKMWCFCLKYDCLNDKLTMYIHHSPFLVI